MVRRVLDSRAADRARAALAGALAWRTRISAECVGIVILYHRVAGTPGDPESELLPAVARAALERELAFVRRRYRVVPARDVVDAARARRRGQRVPLAITFDDDERSHVELAAPCLRSAGLPATFFLTGAGVDGVHVFWWHNLQQLWDMGRVQDVLPDFGSAAADVHSVAYRLIASAPEARAAAVAELGRAIAPDPQHACLDADTIHELSDFDIGWHTRSHDPLTTLDPTDLATALTDGRDRLERIIGRTIDLVAYPHGAADPHVRAAAEAAGFRLGFTSRPGKVGDASDPLRLPRVEPGVAPPGRFALALERAVRHEVEMAS